MSSWQNWAKGLFSAVIGGGANSITLILVDPATFNFTTGGHRLLTVFLSSALLSAAMYLKQSPLPGDPAKP